MLLYLGHTPHRSSPVDKRPRDIMALGMARLNFDKKSDDWSMCWTLFMLETRSEAGGASRLVAEFCEAKEDWAR
jgi:hypothetical protein